MRLRVGGAQIPVTSDMEKNKGEILRAIDQAQKRDIGILLFPEGSLSGYTARFDPVRLRESLAEVRARAAQKRVALALGTCFADEEGCYNAILFYKADGETLEFHTKTLVCGTLEEPSVGEIREFSVKPLRVFDLNGISVGGLICNDLWANPMFTPQEHGSLAYALRRLGAKIIFHAVNGGRGVGPLDKVNWAYHNSSLQLNAAANRLWIVTVDSCEPTDRNCSAPSGVISPDGTWMTQARRKGRDMFQFDIEI